MKSIQIYDPPLCCSTGVCGPDVEPALVRFSADLQWLRDQGVEVQRFGLAQNPAAFVENEKVREALTNTGESALPMVIVADAVIASGHYPPRAALAASVGLSSLSPGIFTPAVAELVAVAAAVAANCEPCLRFHVHEAEKLGVTKADLDAAIAMAENVKGTPHRNVMRLAARLTGGSATSGTAEATATDSGKSSCCS